MKQSIEKNEKIIAWHAPEFEYRHKSLEWYWLTIIGSVILFVVAVWEQDFLFALFLIIAEFLFIHWAREYPKTLRFALTKNGLEIGPKERYGFDQMSGFHIEERNDHAELILKMRNRTHPYLKVIILEEDVPEITAFLHRRIPEIDYEETLTDVFERMIGF
ncbi:MAG: hypothetical protein KGI60_02600 [Patescibacteria group bacterium]|nr:hypothetical protein [Patescibacteria group bacterium]